MAGRADMARRWNRRAPTVIGLLVFSALLAGCAGALQGLYPPAPGELVKPVYVINHGWHTGIAVRRADIPQGVWPEHGDFADFEYVEVGWGDRDFYVARDKYFLLRTCNTWTARALRSAGLPITPLYAVTAGNVMGQARRFGKDVEP